MPSTDHLPPARRGAVFQFSVRTFLWLFTAAIVFAWVGRQAMRGSEILIAIAGALLLVCGFAILCVLFFLIGWLPSFVSNQMGVQSNPEDVYGESAEPPSLPQTQSDLARSVTQSEEPNR